MSEDKENGNDSGLGIPFDFSSWNAWQGLPLPGTDQNFTGNQNNIYQDPQNNISTTELQSQQQLDPGEWQERREIARHYRALERVKHRSNLRCQEQYLKQRMREVHEEIIPKDCGYLYVKINGNGNGLSYCEVFSAQIRSLERYRFQGSNETAWRVVLIEKRTGAEVISPLYKEDDMKITAKLKRTVLAAYDCSDSAKSRSFLWEWLRREMISMLEGAEVVEIPSGPGWFKSGDSCHFYTMADEDTSKFTTYMQRFNMNWIDEPDKNDTLRSLMDVLEHVGDLSIAGMLLLYRFAALLGRLTGKASFPAGLIIWGERAEEAARHYLQTMSNDVDTVNIDSDRLERIRKKVSALQDTPAIFLVTDPDHRSVQNRLREVVSWMQASCIEGESVKAPFVFCIKRFSMAMPLENMLVLDTSGIRLPQDDLALDKFQCAVIEQIERSGTYWTEEIRNEYIRYQRNNIGETLSMMRMTKEVLLKMLNNADALLRIRFWKLLEAGEKEIQAQLSPKTGRLSEMFRDQVSELVDKGTIKIYSKEKAPVSNERNYIYYDSEYYYFTKDIMEMIGKMAGMDRKTILYVRQELYALSMVKTYQSAGYRPKEFYIDFRICNDYGQRKDLSGVAITRRFWDEEGGIALCERG